MINKIEQINLVSIVKEDSSVVSFSKPFTNRIVYSNSLDSFSSKGEAPIHGVLYFSDTVHLEKDETYLKLTEKFPVLLFSNCERFDSLFIAR